MVDSDANDLAAWEMLMQAHQHIAGSVEAALKAADQPNVEWYRVLRALDDAGSDGLRPFELQARLGTPQYALSRLVQRMTDAGLLVREQLPNDRRGHRLTLSDQGAGTLRRMWPIYRSSILAAIRLKLDDGEVETLTRLLGRLI